MAGFAQGKHAYGISDRSGFRYRLRDMRFEWNGSLVHQSEFETKHPQIETRRHIADKQGLKNAKPDRIETAAPNLLKTDAFKTGSASSSTITVTETNHGRSTSDTVRFRDSESFDGITASNINRSAGYTITKVDDNTYTFSVSTDTATSGNINGGGFRAYAGPVTVVA